MRTETDLQEALNALADTAPSPAEFLDRLQLPPDPAVAANHRRRNALVVALAALLLIVAVGVPSVLRSRTVEPADARVPGHWEMVSTIEPPPGWLVESRVIQHDAENIGLRRTAGGGDDTCEVLVASRGKWTPEPGEAATAGDKSGTYRPWTSENHGGFAWLYGSEAWASISCTYAAPRSTILDLAARVQFAPTPMDIPFTLDLPKTSAVQDVSEIRLEDGRLGFGVTVIVGTDENPARLDESPLLQSAISIDSGAALERPKPGIPGVEDLVINGRTALLRADNRSLCVEGAVCVRSFGGGDTDSDGVLWRPGEREILMETAKNVRLARDMDEPSTWFDANDALPN